MNKVKFIMMTVVLLLGSLTITAQETSGDLDAQYAGQLLKPGTAAPDFVIADRGGADTMRLSDLRGQYVVLDFWASWCPDCRKDIASVKAMYERFGSMNVQFVGISFDTDRRAWLNCVEKFGMAWLQHSELKKWKKETKIDAAYHIDWIPSYYLLDKEGKVVLATVQHEKIAARLAALETQGDIKAYRADCSSCAGKIHCPVASK